MQNRGNAIDRVNFCDFVSLKEGPKASTDELKRGQKLVVIRVIIYD
jgi:hypothetical protein